MDTRTRRMLRAAHTAAENKYAVGGNTKKRDQRKPITLPKLEMKDVRIQLTCRPDSPRSDR